MNTDRERIIDVFGNFLLKLDDIDAATALGIVEGMAIKADLMKEHALKENENRPAE